MSFPHRSPDLVSSPQMSLTHRFRRQQFANQLRSCIVLLLGTGTPAALLSAAEVTTLPTGEFFTLQARASDIDSRVQSYPEINFVLSGADGSVTDLQNASVDTRVESRGQLVIWLMSHKVQLFERINSYGLHAIQPHYARQWFGICCQERPVGPHCRGSMRLEAATGEDFTDEVMIAKPDGMTERSFQFVRWLYKENPEGNWGQFINDAGDGLRWDKVIMAGASHGSTTSARFAKHQKVARVVALCGPRDQYQGLAKAAVGDTRESLLWIFTCAGRWLDRRSLLPIVGSCLGCTNSAQLLTSTRSRFPMKTREDWSQHLTLKAMHESSQLGHSGWLCKRRHRMGNSPTKMFGRYMFTHPVDSVGKATELDAGCNKDQ